MSETPPPEAERLPAGSRGELQAARLQLLRAAKRRLAIQLPSLDPDLYASTEELDELRRIATAGRGAEIRILLHDPAAALREDHRLIALVQRLPSVLQVRMPIDERDLALGAAWLLTDAGGYLYQPDAKVFQGRASSCDRPAQVPLQLLFDERWERAEPASILQPLGI